MFVKICCVQSVAEAEMALAAGASALGLVSSMPSGPGVIDEQSIREIAQAVGERALTVLLTRETRHASVVEQTRYCGTRAVQLVARYRDPYPALADALAGTRVIQVLHVRGERDVEQARVVAGSVDMLLLDSGRPDAEVAELGGTGRVHDWSLSRRIVAGASCPVLLAGGLDAENVGSAIETVGPHGLDVCSGVRTNEALDGIELARFMAAVRGD